VIIFPAIDLRDGKCVRLIEGDFERETVFDDDPAAAARRWREAGATWLHVVDLDGARTGESGNLDAIAAIVQAVDCPVQVGGGIRSVESAEQLFSAGVSRVIVGTAIVTDPEMVDALVCQFPGKVVAGLDARDGNLALSGWLEQGSVSALETARDLPARGIETVVFTDIRRDGTLSGPNVDALTEMIAIPGIEVIASGGIGSIDDVRNVAEAGAAGVIIGRALYDGRVTLTEVLQWQS
jgi:phosphoribosylformimino-5-aminoimidazole carboxamide ribotide isomerase